MGYGLPEKLVEFIKSEAEEAEYFVLDISSRGGAGKSLDVTIDKNNGITLAECAEFNRKISFWLENNGDSGGGYTVDVSSPGLDRVLKSDADLEWAEGKKITVSTYEPVEDKKHFVGKLLSHKDGEIIVEEDGGCEVSLQRKNIAKARLEVEI